MQKVCVVIPIHSPDPTAFELISFKQCFSILGQHPIYVLAPNGLNLSNYKNVISKFQVISVDAKWQSSLANYNKLKISRYFYELFGKYEYMLTYELDAFVFNDELLKWCDIGYDYIGAPWFEHYSNATPGSKMVGVGNSGFSLRKITTIRKILKSYYYKSPEEYNRGKINLINAYLKYPYQWVMNLSKENYTIQKYCKYYEDYFFCKIIPRTYKQFAIAPIDKALQFSFEVNPPILFKQNNEKLPFGCHAWWRYDLEFWKPHIEKYGYHLF